MVKYVELSPILPSLIQAQIESKMDTRQVVFVIFYRVAGLHNGRKHYRTYTVTLPPQHAPRSIQLPSYDTRIGHLGGTATKCSITQRLCHLRLGDFF